MTIFTQMVISSVHWRRIMEDGAEGGQKRKIYEFKRYYNFFFKQTGNFILSTFHYSSDIC